MSETPEFPQKLIVEDSFYDRLLLGASDEAYSGAEEDFEDLVARYGELSVDDVASLCADVNKYAELINHVSLDKDENYVIRRAARGIAVTSRLLGHEETYQSSREYLKSLGPSGKLSGWITTWVTRKHVT